jgi:hypothetical protein
MPVIPYIHIKNKTKVDVLGPETSYQNKNYAYKENETTDLIQWSLASYMLTADSWVSRLVEVLV